MRNGGPQRLSAARFVFHEEDNRMYRTWIVMGAVLVAAMVGMTAFGDETAAKTGAQASSAPVTAEKPASVLSFTMNDIDGKAVKLEDKYKGDVLLVVNTASKCGYTPQYADLEAVYQKYHEKGLDVLAFPSNDFGSQEPGTEAEIKEFCTSKFHVTFPLFAKITVKGPNKNSLYAYLTSSEANASTTGEIKWNFTKFLVGRDGRVEARFEPGVKPTDEGVTQAIEKALAAKSEAAKS
jgi:glutathione peroxidase